jgi:cytochrome c
MRLLAIGTVLILVLSIPAAQQGAAQKKNEDGGKRPTGNAARGADLFEANCWDCHNTGSNERKVGPGLKGIKDGKLPSGKDATRENLLENLNKGSQEMPPFEKGLTEQQKEDIITYVLTL